MEEYKFAQFFSRHFWKLASAVFAVSMLAIFFNRYISSKESEKKQDFLTIKTVFESFNRGEALSKESLDMAENILNRHPELHTQYDALMAISFAVNGNIEKMNAFAPHKEQTAPFYTSFAKTTLLINQQELMAALQEAEKLEEALNDNHNYATLACFNLLRIAFLSKRLNNVPSQVKAFSKLETLKTYPQVAALFQEGTFTLKDFFIYTQESPFLKNS